MSYLVLDKNYGLSSYKELYESLRNKVLGVCEFLGDNLNLDLPWDLYKKTYGEDLIITPLEFAEAYTGYFGSFENKDIDIHSRVKYVHDYLKNMKSRELGEMPIVNNGGLEGKLMNSGDVEPSNFSWKKF